jgi:hypothetical protein
VVVSIMDGQKGFAEDKNVSWSIAAPRGGSADRLPILVIEPRL